ncbi:MAG: hypothetical protein AAGD96_27695 [Chloroflexota bacterium]
MSDNSNSTIEELETKLKAAKRTQLTVMIIFGLIILAWIVLGYWRDNTPVFITTIALAIAISFATSTAPRKLTADIDKLKAEQAAD